jgi:hypothetical protein
VLLLSQHGALLHAYSHFGIVPDPYAIGDTQAPPAQGCDLGVVHAALDGDPPNTAAVLAPQLPPSVAAEVAVTAFTPLLLRSFETRAPPTRS